MLILLLQLSEKPERGDIIEIFHPSYVDWAIYVGNDEVIHLTPCSGKVSLRCDFPRIDRGLVLCTASKAAVCNTSTPYVCWFMSWLLHNQS